MTETFECLIWGTPAELLSTADHENILTIRSFRAGGEYSIRDKGRESLVGLDELGREKLSTWIVDQIRLGNSPAIITPSVIDEIRQTPKLSVSQRRLRLVQFLDFRLTDIGEDVGVAGVMSDTTRNDQQAMLAWTESLTDRETWFLISSCVEEGSVEQTRNGNGIRVSIKGYEILDQLAQDSANSSQAFVAMWFNESLDAAYRDGFSRAIRDSGYQSLRIDQKEHVNKIDDEIVAEIRRSRFVVADFTALLVQHGDDIIYEARGGVYFEAGFALGLNLPVIWSCREDLINYVHFDTRQFNHIVWSDADDLYSKLRNRIGAVIGDGLLK